MLNESEKFIKKYELWLDGVCTKIGQWTFQFFPKRHLSIFGFMQIIWQMWVLSLPFFIRFYSWRHLVKNTEMINGRVMIRKRAFHISSLWAKWMTLKILFSHGFAWSPNHLPNIQLMSDLKSCRLDKGKRIFFSAW